MRNRTMAEVLRRLALEAGDAIMAVYERGAVAVEAKADASPLTEADLAADAVIVAGLEAAFPDIAIVTEERADSHAIDGAAPHFLVDPLDGTKEFVNRRGEFTVNIALIEGGRPVAGVVCAPALRRLARTAAPEEGGGALEEDLAGGAARPLRVAAPDPAALRVVASKSHRDPATETYIAQLGAETFTSAGSSLKFLLVAAGEADVYPRLGRTMEWDTAAGQAVLEAAGGVVARLSDGAPLRYGKPGRDNPHFVAHAPGISPPIQGQR